MKKHFLLLCSLSLFLFTAVCAQETPVRIACVGNSITYGYGITPRDKNSYPGQLQSMLGKKIAVKNFGVNGSTLLRKGNLPYWKENAFSDALAFQPNIVFIMLGTNDSKKINRPFYNDFEQDYSDLIDSFRLLSTHPRVIMLMPIATFSPDSNRIFDSVIVQKIIPMCEEVAYKKQVEMINLHPVFLGSKGDSAKLFDKIHPNPLGDQAIAQRLYQQLLLKTSTEDIFNKINVPKTISSYHGYVCADFKINGFDCKVVKPYIATSGKPWLWRARFWGNEPQNEIAMLERGYYLVYCDVAELYGNKKCINAWDNFYNFLQQNLHLDKKTILFGYSRGGIYIYNWAVVNPGKVAAIYADAPVLDFKIWYGGGGRGIRSKPAWELFKKDYGFTNDKQALAFKGSPLNKVKQIVAGHYPMLHVVGDADTIVRIAENTAPFEKAVKKAGGNISVIHKPEGYHHPHSLANPSPITNFMLRATGHFVNLAVVPAPGAEYRSLPAGWVVKTTWYDQADDIQHTLDSLGKVDILMLGNSITQGIGGRSLITEEAGRIPFENQFKGYTLANAGISGDRVQNLMWRLENYNYNICKPKVAIITIGVNNFQDDATPQEIAAGIKKLVTATRQKLPNSKILLIGPLPAGYTSGSALRKKYDAVHKLITSLTDNKSVFFYKYNNEMLLPNGNLNLKLYSGDIHLQATGYAQWAKYLYKQMKDDHLL